MAPTPDRLQFTVSPFKPFKTSAMLSTCCAVVLVSSTEQPSNQPSTLILPSVPWVMADSCDDMLQAAVL